LRRSRTGSLLLAVSAEFTDASGMGYSPMGYLRI